MLNGYDILYEEFEALRSDIVDKFHDAAVYAAGDPEWETVILTKETPDVCTSYSLASRCSDDPVNSRKNGGRFSAGDMGERICYNNISFKGPVSSIAFLAAEKIYAETTGNYDARGVQLLKRVVTPGRIQLIIDRIAGSYGFESYQIFINAFKNYFENGSNNMDR